MFISTGMDCSGINLHLENVMRNSKQETTTWTSAATQGEGQTPCLHYRQQTVLMMMMMMCHDSFYVKPCLVSTGPIISGVCKQEKTLHTWWDWPWSECLVWFLKNRSFMFVFSVRVSVCRPWFMRHSDGVNIFVLVRSVLKSKWLLESGITEARQSLWT